jgi:hypothetical protein
MFAQCTTVLALFRDRTVVSSITGNITRTLLEVKLCHGVLDRSNLITLEVYSIFFVQLHIACGNMMRRWLLPTAWCLVVRCDDIATGRHDDSALRFVFLVATYACLAGNNVRGPGCGLCFSSWPSTSRIKHPNTPEFVWFSVVSSYIVPELGW